MTATKHALNERKSDSSTNTTWHLKPLNNAFLQSILYMVSNMFDKERILLVLYLVQNNAPEGADQVEAAYECYIFAVEHEEALNQDDRSREIVLKIKKKYPILKVQHLLHLYGLYDDKLAQHVKNPIELINALYVHASDKKMEIKCDLNKVSLMKKYEKNKFCDDYTYSCSCFHFLIFQVAEEIAELHELDFDQIQLSLLKNWLSFAIEEEDNPLDQTFYDDLNSTISTANGEFQMNDTMVER